jgi:6-phosphogluconolactonase
MMSIGLQNVGTEIHRKNILRLSALVALVLGLALPVYSASGPQQISGSNEFFIYIGSSKSERTESKGIYVYRFNPSRGELTSLGMVRVTNPAFLAVPPSQRFLYAVNQTPDYDTSAVTAFAIDRATGQLTLLNQVPSRGANPVYALVDKTGRYVVIANYIGGSVATFPLLDDGRLGQAAAFVQYSGASMINHPERPKGSYPHSIDISPDNRFALVTALGLDRLFIYHFDQEHGSLSDNDPPTVDLPPGSGPRHIAFDKTGKHVYVVNETRGTVTVFSYNAAHGALRALQTISTLPKAFKGVNASAEIEVYPTGKFLYASNRGPDSIAVFAIESSKGTLKPIQNVPTQGKGPGNFQIDPTGSYLFVANENSNNVVVFRIDPKTGSLTSTGQQFRVPCPQNIVFVGIE